MITAILSSNRFGAIWALIVNGPTEQLALMIDTIASFDKIETSTKTLLFSARLGAIFGLGCRKLNDRCFIEANAC